MRNEDLKAEKNRSLGETKWKAIQLLSNQRPNFWEERVTTPLKMDHLPSEGGRKPFSSQSTHSGLLKTSLNPFSPSGNNKILSLHAPHTKKPSPKRGNKCFIISSFLFDFKFFLLSLLLSFLKTCYQTKLPPKRFFLSKKNI